MRFALRSWKFWIGVLISAICVYIALQGLNLREFWDTVREANYWWLIPGIAIYFVAVWVRTWRWNAMLRHIKVIPLARLFPVVVIGYMGNNVYPARAGEVLRSYVLRRKEGVPISASLATVVLERLFDGLVMLLFVFVTLPFTPLPAGYSSVVTVFSLLFLTALGVFFYLAARPEQMKKMYGWFVERLVPSGWRPRIYGLFDPFIAGLQSLRSPRELLTIFATSTLIWLTETTKYWFVMHAFDFSVPFTVLMLMTAVVNLFTTLPSTPGYVGTFHVPGIAVLVAAGVDQAVATGYTVVLHAALWLPITALGGLFMLLEHIKWSDMDRAVEERSLEIAS
jgi:uncharacterized protein (TIRG00374 family)